MITALTVPLTLRAAVLSGSLSMAACGPKALPVTNAQVTPPVAAAAARPRSAAPVRETRAAQGAPARPFAAARGNPRLPVPRAQAVAYHIVVARHSLSLTAPPPAL